MSESPVERCNTNRNEEQGVYDVSLLTRKGLGLSGTFSSYSVETGDWVSQPEEGRNAELRIVRKGFSSGEVIDTVSIGANDTVKGEVPPKTKILPIFDLRLVAFVPQSLQMRIFSPDRPRWEFIKLCGELRRD